MKITQMDMVIPQFIRFGKIPKNGKSGIYCGDSGKVGEEAGVSVYEAIERDGKHKIIMPTLSYSACVSLSSCIEREAYLVKGKVCGIGKDGEPLLKNCKIIKKIVV